MPWKHVSISSLEMVNFKRFYGHHRIDLLSRPDIGKPIILIGGDNGRGKTSIHEAIYYALYIDDDLPGIHTRPSYFRAISDRLNRRALDEGSQDYSVAVDLFAIDASSGQERNIRIERQWNVNTQTRFVEETSLEITENGRIMDMIDDSQSSYQIFLRTLLPPKIAPFFFFDGERIQEFADEEDKKHMVEAIEDILHITVYKSLRDDLKKHVIDYIDREEVDVFGIDDLRSLVIDQERLEDEIEKLRDNLADANSDSSDLLREQKRVEKELLRIASPHSSDREMLIIQQTNITAELHECEVDVQNQFSSLPILLTGNLRRDLIEALETEEIGLSSPEQIEFMSQTIDNIVIALKNELMPKDPWELIRFTSEQIDYCCSLVKVIAENSFHINDTKNHISIHDIGSFIRKKIRQRLHEAEQIASQLAISLNRRERLSSELKGVEIKLSSTTDDPYVLELLDNNNRIATQLGILEQQQNMFAGEIQRKTNELAIRIRQIEDRQEKREKNTHAKRTVQLAIRARRTLDAFIKDLAIEKLETLKKCMSEMYMRVRKDEDPVREIDIDSDTWQILMFDEKKRPLEKRVFSQGMKEMYALSLLWALSRASGREFPIVIDTPLGRLDSINRETLCRQYFPNAGHQVIILSTDKEIDREWFNILKDKVAHQYTLDYDYKTESTVIRPGYFF